MDCEKVVMYSGEEEWDNGKVVGQNWAGNQAYNLTHISIMLLHWWKEYKPEPRPGNTITMSKLKNNHGRSATENNSLARGHYTNPSLDLGFLEETSAGVFSITEDGIRYMKLWDYDDFIANHLSGNIDNLLNGKGECFSQSAFLPPLNEPQQMMMREKLLEICFDKDLKMMFLKQLRFMRFYDGKWMPKKGDNNAATSAIRNFPEQIGLFKILFRKTLSPSQGGGLGPIGFGTINNTLTETGVKLEQIGAVREITGTSTLGPGSDYKITKEGEELYTKLEKQYEEARAMPFEVRNDYKIKQTNAGGRFWLEGGNRDWWDNSGFPKDTPIRVEYGDGIMTIQPCAEQDKDHIISTDRKLVDIKNHDVDKALRTNNNDTIVKYTVYPFKIVVETI